MCTSYHGLEPEDARRHARADVFRRMAATGWDPAQVGVVLNDYETDLHLINARAAS